MIIDGNSTDGSKGIIQKYCEILPNLRASSEPDYGIYDAMNKGIERSKGEFVAFLNSGDVLHSTDVLKVILNELVNCSNVEFLYGDVEVSSVRKGLRRYWRAGHFRPWFLYVGWMSPHPLATIKKSLICDAGGFDLRYKIAADYCLMLDVLKQKAIKVAYVPRCLVTMEAGGVSNSSIKQIACANLEIMSHWYRRTPYLVPFWIFITKPLSKLLQYRSK